MACLGWTRRLVDILGAGTRLRRRSQEHLYDAYRLHDNHESQSQRGHSGPYPRPRRTPPSPESPTTLRIAKVRLKLHFAVTLVNTGAPDGYESHKGEGKLVENDRSPLASSLNCQKRLANVPHTTTAHPPKLQTKCRSSDGVVLAQGCQKQPSTNQNQSKHTPMQSAPGPRDSDLHDARRLQGRSTHDAMQVTRRLGQLETALAMQKQREAVLKRWGGAEP